MYRNLRRASVAALLAAGCVISTSSHAFGAVDDAEAQDQEVKAAYDRGYQAAKQELALQAATTASPSANTPAATKATVPATQKATTAASPPRKPILDIKSTYSDAGHAETVQEIPVTAMPLPEQTGPQAPPPTQARVVRPLPVYAQVAAATEDLANQRSPQRQQTGRTADREGQAQPHDPGNGLSPRRVVQRDAAPAEQTAYDEADDESDPPPGTAQQYADETPHYARPTAQYAPPVAWQQAPQLPQPYGYAQQPAYASAQQYGYVQQQPAYAARRPYTYYAPQAPWVAQYRPAPQTGRWYWSPQYGRWLYY